MPSLEPTSPSGRKRASESDPIAEKIQARLAELRASEVNPEDAVEQGLLAILETTDIAAGAICLFDARQQVLRLAAERGLSDQGCRSLRHIRRGFAGAWDMPLQSLSNRRVYLIENAAQNRYVPPLIDEPDKMRTVLCLPLLTGNTPVGSLIIVSTARKPFADQDVARLEAPGRELAVIIEAARARMRQAERASSAAAPAPDQPYRGRSNAESLIGQRFDLDQEIIRARDQASEWERKHQELAGELAAATAREQRLRDELTAAAERLQDFSHSTRGKGTKDEAAQLAQNARLQASLAEAEAIAARERMRATEHEHKLAEMAELLSGATAREEALRQLAEKGGSDGDPAKRKEFIDQSLEIARLNARLADTEAALLQARSQPAPDANAAANAAELADALAKVAASEQTLEKTRAEVEGKLQAQQATFDAERGKLEGRIADLDTSLAEVRQGTQTAEAELAAVRARENALQEELEAAAAQHQRLLAEADERERQREQARSGELRQLQSALNDANEAAQRANERLVALEQRHQDVAGQLAATTTREQALREELESSARAQQARAIELEALLEHERTLVADWQRKHQALEAEFGKAAERERQRLAEDLRGNEMTAAEVAAVQDAKLGIELQQLRERLVEVEATGARDAERASEWEQRCTALSSQLDDVVARNGQIDRELGELRGQLAARSAEAAAESAEKAVETETLAARLAAAEAARAAAEQSSTSWAQRHDALAAEFEAAVARAEDLARALEAVRADTANDRVAAEGARAAAQVDAEATRVSLNEAQQRVEALTREVSELRETVATLEREGEARSAELAAALAAQTARAIEALEPAPAPRPAPAPIRTVTPVTPPARVSTDVKRIAVIDDPAGWQNVKLHGVDTVVLAPADDLASRLGGAPADRALVNLAARGIFDAILAARAGGAKVPICGCLIPPGLSRGLSLGFVEIVHAPLDPDEVTAVLAPYAGRGTRVLTAGADADAFISLRQALARQGMSVSMAWDGKQASDLLQMVRPEIVVVDLDIPPRSGLGLIVELSVAPIMPMLVLLPGRQDVGKRTAAELSDPGLAGRLLPPDRLLDAVRRSGKPK